MLFRSASDVFQNDYPVHIEIGMGKGRFLMALAQKNPQINYIGIERYTSVLLRAVEKLNIYIEENESTLPNIRFICMDAQDIANVFAENEVDRIYLNQFAPPTNFVVPMVGAIQDRASIEVLRGCVRGCRFCQAGFLYRPKIGRASCRERV